MNVFGLEAKMMLRKRGAVLPLLGYLLLSIIAIVNGSLWFDHLQESSALQRTLFEQHLEEVQTTQATKSPGSLAYGLKAPASFEPSPWSVLFSGETREHLLQMRVRMLAVQGQIHATPLSNLEHLKLGWFDMTFLWLYIMPMLVGLMTITLLAEDKVSGRLGLVGSFVESKNAYIVQRLMPRFVIFAVINLLTLLAAFILVPLAFDGTFLIVMGALLLYQTFWFFISYLIIAAGKTATQNILMYLSVWAVFTIVLPSLNFMANLDSKNLNTGIEMLFTQRQVMNDSWDKNMQAELDTYLEKHPEWNPTERLGPEFDWKWYYAMQHTSDDSVTELAGTYRETINQAASVNGINLLSPTLMMQSLLQRIANSDAWAYQDFVRQVEQWHDKQLRQFWYPHFFFKKPWNIENLKKLPTFSHQPTANDYWQQYLIIILLQGLLLLTLVVFAKRRLNRVV